MYYKAGISDLLTFFLLLLLFVFILPDVFFLAPAKDNRHESLQVVYAFFALWKQHITGKV